MVIGFMGAAGAGKSTAANVVATNFKDQNPVAISFADPIRGFIAMLGIDPADRDIREIPSLMLSGHSPRYVMQTLGTEWGRSLHEDFWVNIWRSRVANVPAGHIILVEDVRFPNEHAAVQEFDGILIRVTGRGGIAGNHASETEQEALEADYTIDNSREPLFMTDELTGIVRRELEVREAFGNG